MEIQNAGLGEHRIRDLNDEINQLLKVKWQWEMRIIELGGPNYIASAPKMEDADGEWWRPRGARATLTSTSARRKICPG